MTTYNTGNPIGSTAVKDLYDNAENLDVLVNDKSKLSHPDRLGVERKTWHGMEQDFNADQTERQNRFNNFIASSGYQLLGDYATGIEITEYNQIVRGADGELWRLSGQVELPYTTTGDWSIEGGLFVSVGDAALRQDLANPDKGAALVGRGVVAVESVTDLLALPEEQRKEGLRYLVKGYYLGSDEGGGEFYWDVEGDEFRRIVKGPVTPQMFGVEGDDITEALNQALLSGASSIRIPSGNWKMSGPLVAQAQDTHVFGDGFSSVLEFTGVPLCVDMSKNRMRLSDMTIRVNGPGTALRIKATPATPLYNFDNACSNVLFVGDHTQDNLGIDLQSYINTFTNCHIINFRTLVRFGDESNRNTFLGCTLRAEHTSPGTPEDAALLIAAPDAGTGNSFIGCDIEGSPNYYLKQSGGQISFIGGYFEGARRPFGILQDTPYSEAICTLKDVFYSAGVALPPRGNKLSFDECWIHGAGFSETWPAVQNYTGLSEFGSFSLRGGYNQPNLLRIALGGAPDSYGILDALRGNYNTRPEHFEFIDVFSRGAIIHNRGSDSLRQSFAPIAITGPARNGFTAHKEKYVGEILAGTTREWVIAGSLQDANYTVEVRCLRNGRAVDAAEYARIHVYTGSASPDHFRATVDREVVGDLVEVSVVSSGGYVRLQVRNLSESEFSFYCYATVSGCVELD